MELFIFSGILFFLGLILMRLSWFYKQKIKKMAANFTGDIVPDKENDEMYKYEMRIYLKFQTGSYYFGLIFLFWGFVFLLVILYYFFI